MTLSPSVIHDHFHKKGYVCCYDTNLFSFKSVVQCFCTFVSQSSMTIYLFHYFIYKLHWTSVQYYFIIYFQEFKSCYLMRLFVLFFKGFSLMMTITSLMFHSTFSLSVCFFWKSSFAGIIVGNNVWCSCWSPPPKVILPATKHCWMLLEIVFDALVDSTLPQDNLSSHQALLNAFRISVTNGVWCSCWFPFPTR